MGVFKNTYAIKILISLLIVGVIAGIIVAITTSSDSENKITPSPPGIETKWVAVGNTESEVGGYGTIMYSSNGQSWTKTTSGDSFRDPAATATNRAKGNGVAYGTCNGVPLWVAVGNNGTSYGNIMYSSDGQSWTKTSTGDSFSSLGFGVAYGTSNGTSPLWVAVGQVVGGGYGNIMYSSDGQSWTKTSTGDNFSYEGRGVAYRTVNGSPLWVAVGSERVTGGGAIMYSNNGKEWTKTFAGDSFGGYGYGVAAKHLLYGMDKDYYHPQ